MSLVLAVIAALVVFLAALVSDARISTVFLRSIFHFLNLSAICHAVLLSVGLRGPLSEAGLPVSFPPDCVIPG